MVFAGKTLKFSSEISIHDVVLLKSFRLNITHPSPRIVKDVIWFPPLLNWIKDNSYGAFTDNLTTVGGIFRNSYGVHLGSFSCFLDRATLFLRRLWVRFSPLSTPLLLIGLIFG